MLGIASAYYAIPIVRDVPNFDQRLGRLGFWLVFPSMLGLALSFAMGGTVQIFVYRVLGLDWFGGEVAPAMGLFKLLLPLFGLVFAIGAGLIAFDLVTLGRRATSPLAAAADSGRPSPLREATRWSRPLSGFEAGLWLTGMWVFGAIVTLGLLSFNLARVRVAGDPTLPYLLAAVGYPGLFLTTLAFVARFLASLEERASVRRAAPVKAPAPVMEPV
jgi:nitric oxide reductase subunit B